MTRCKSCLTNAEALNGLCPVCGIGQHKKKAELSPAEKKVRFHARGIRLVSIIHLIGAAMGIMMMPEFPAPAAMAVLAVINALLAYGLSRYSFIAYKGATVYYFLIGIMNIVSIQQAPIQNLVGIASALVALYLVGNATSKSIFERLLPETS